jgi:hypothetical protein
MIVYQALADWLSADLFSWTVRLVHAAAIGQTLFVFQWAFLPWYRTVIGRALMVKSLSLMLYLDWTLVVYHWGPLTDQQTIAVVLFGLITFGIWSQLVALNHEIWRTRRERP